MQAVYRVANPSFLGRPPRRRLSQAALVSSDPQGWDGGDFMAWWSLYQRSRDERPDCRIPFYAEEGFQNFNANMLPTSAAGAMLSDDDLAIIRQWQACITQDAPQNGEPSNGEPSDADAPSEDPLGIPAWGWALGAVGVVTALVVAS